MRFTALILAVAAACITLAAAADTPDPAMTAGDLQQLCLGEDHVSQNVCRVYILGVTQGIAVGLGLAGHHSTGQRPCVPADISAEMLEQTVKTKLGDDLTVHPEDRHREASGFIAVVLAQTYACAKAH